MSVEFEHRFWLQILGDHLRFIEATLAAKELKLLEDTKRLKAQFDSLLSAVREEQSLSAADILRAVLRLKDFKQQILALQLTGKVDINLPPTFVNHMLNELEEYQRMLISLQQT